MQKRYAIMASPFYKLWTRKRLATVLCLTPPQLTTAIQLPQYRVFENDKKRLCQQPIGLTAAIHALIAKLLARLQTPDFLMSVKGKSYIDNARHHIGNFPSIRLDISKYYPSTKERRIWEFFRFQAMCSNQVARDLAQLCSFEGALPTGSPISGYLAFWANHIMFDELDRLAKSAECTMTVYVDDIMISGLGANEDLFRRAIQIIRASNLKHNRRKSRVLPAGKVKRITGVIVTGADIKVPNERQQKIGILFSQTSAGDSTCKPNLLGRLAEASQIDCNFKNKIVTVAIVSG
jgi:RNA-directed DNA polymerase